MFYGWPNYDDLFLVFILKKRTIQKILFISLILRKTIFSLKGQGNSNIINN
jgi:hypothetical protein